MCLMSAQTDALPYDLLRPPLLGAEERRRLAAAARAFSQAASSLASEYLSTPVRFSLCACPSETAAAPASVWVLAAGLDHEHAPVWRLDLSLAAAVVDVMLGVAAHRRPDPARPLSRMEARLVARFCREVFIAFSATWPLRAAGPDDWRCIRGGADVPGPCPPEWTPVVFQVSCEGASGLLDLHLPLSIARLPVGARHSDTPSAAAGPARATANPAVRATRIPLSVTLGTWRTSLQELLALEPGQTVPLDAPADSALALSIGGTPRFTVKPGIHNGLVSVRVIGPVEE
jgi:flagellar motor switch protein FliM